MKKKYTHEFVKKFFKDHNCILLNQYINTSSQLLYVCSCGNNSTTNFFNFQKGLKKCLKCRNIFITDKQRYTLEFVQDYFLNNNCKLLAKEYKNNKTLMPYICSCGVESKIKFNDFKSGVRCKNCGYQKISKENSCLWIKDREYVNRIKYISRRCSRLINRCINLFGIIKTNHTCDLLRYKATELDNYIKNHSNYLYTIQKTKETNDKFSIDHIFPIKAFFDYNLDKEEYLWLINSLDNLQPMPLKENISKNDFYIKEEFEKWLFTKGVVV